LRPLRLAPAAARAPFLVILYRAPSPPSGRKGEKIDVRLISSIYARRLPFQRRALPCLASPPLQKGRTLFHPVKDLFHASRKGA